MRDTRKTVLICVDEADLRELVRVALGPHRRFVEAGDGHTALALVQRIDPDLVVLDLMLPGPSGVDVLRAIRNDPATRNVPVVVITAWSHARDDAVTAGADRFVVKPFEPEELKAVVDDLLEPS